MLGKAIWLADPITISASSATNGKAHGSITTTTCVENAFANIAQWSNRISTIPSFLAERPRYARLFDLRVTDYKGWAKGLQKCGYATDRAYANKLIKVIEDYELYRYDRMKVVKKTTKRTTTSNQQPTQSAYQVYRTHGLIYVYAQENDSFDHIAANLGFSPRKLRKYNEVPEDFPLEKGDIIYLEKKKKKADKPYSQHVVQVGESMHDIAQKYGIQIKSLYKMNKKSADYIPMEGDVLKLR